MKIWAQYLGDYFTDRRVGLFQLHGLIGDTRINIVSGELIFPIATTSFTDSELMTSHMQHPPFCLARFWGEIGKHTTVELVPPEEYLCTFIRQPPMSTSYKNAEGKAMCWRMSK